MEFIILFLVVGFLGYLVLFQPFNEINFSIENSLGDVVYVHNCYFITHSEFGKQTDPIIYRIYQDLNGKYSFRGYGKGWEEHSNYKQIFQWYRGVVEGIYEIKGGKIIAK